MSQLKKALGTKEACQLIHPYLDATLEWIMEPDQVLGIRLAPTGQPPGKEVLIQWKDLPPSDASWESVDSIIQLPP